MLVSNQELSYFFRDTDWYWIGFDCVTVSYIDKIDWVVHCWPLIHMWPYAYLYGAPYMLRSSNPLINLNNGWACHVHSIIIDWSMHELITDIFMKLLTQKITVELWPICIWELYYSLGFWWGYSHVYIFIFIRNSL